MNILLKSLTITWSLFGGLQAMEIENNSPGNCAPEVACKFLLEVVKDNYIKHDFTNFLESVRPLREVCSDWNQIIDKGFMHKAMVLGCQQICPEFLNGKLIYRPKEGSDEGMVVFNILDLWNPLQGTFNLSKCGDTGQYLSISTGYRKVKKAENADKVEIWFTPWFLKEIFPVKWEDSAGVGIFWNWGGWNNLGWYDYLTSESADNLSKINLYEHWRKSALRNVSVNGVTMVMRTAALAGRESVGCGRYVSCFVCELK